jgi:hypothetical protein
VRQFLRPRNKLQGPSAPIISTAPRANVPRRSARASISALPMPASTTAQRITKVAKADVAPAPVTASIPARKTAGRAMSHTATSAPPPRGMALGGVQRPPVATKVAPPSTASASSRVRAQRSKQVMGQASSTTSKVASVGTTGPRPSGLRPPTSRVGAAGIAMPRASTSGGATRLSDDCWSVGIDWCDQDRDCQRRWRVGYCTHDAPGVNEPRINSSPWTFLFRVFFSLNSYSRMHGRARPTSDEPRQCTYENELNKSQ